MLKIEYAAVLEDCMVEVMEHERVFDRRRISETGRAHAIAKARSLSGKKSKTTESAKLEALAEALEARPDLKLILEAAAGIRPDAKALSELSESDFSSHFAATIAASAGRRLAPPGQRQRLVAESTPETRPDAKELAEMDSATFSNHYAATIAASRSGR